MQLIGKRRKERADVSGVHEAIRKGVLRVFTSISVRTPACAPLDQDVADIAKRFSPTCSL